MRRASGRSGFIVVQAFVYAGLGWLMCGVGKEGNKKRQEPQAKGNSLLSAGFPEKEGGFCREEKAPFKKAPEKAAVMEDRWLLVGCQILEGLSFLRHDNSCCVRSEARRQKKQHFVGIGWSLSPGPAFTEAPAEKESQNKWETEGVLVAAATKAEGEPSHPRLFSLFPFWLVWPRALALSLLLSGLPWRTVARFSRVSPTNFTPTTQTPLNLATPAFLT
ncbi:hypothetical protein BJ508DRAFT_36768 [Ascobolus immersus RN42]|uniref:Uncharacterized protein n=1 Tax=Ascobolus immersus RN42 TaxID=1160509 RepID=A0A3N4II04_ASCIM|nr:hypothetical protein BJ508DRAFT_36768 [Ascobolus immersus RN42]